MQGSMIVVVICTVIAIICGVTSGAAASDARNVGRTDMYGTYSVAGVIALSLFSLVAFFATQSITLWILATLVMAIFGGFASYMPLLAYDHTYTAHAQKEYSYCAEACQWALSNFDRIAPEGVEYFTSADIERVLRNQSTADADRRMLGFFHGKIAEVGKEVCVFRSYRVFIREEIIESPETIQVYGINRNDLETYPQRLLERKSIGGWIRDDKLKSL